MKKILSAILTIAMLVTVMSITSFASEETVEADSYEELASALNEAKGGETIKVTAAEITSIPAIYVPVTIIGAAGGVEGAKVTVAQNAGEHQFNNIDGTVTIKNFTFSNAAETIRTDYLSNDHSKLSLVIDSCNFENISNYAIMGGSSEKNHVLYSLTVKDCNFTASEEKFTSNYMIYAQCVQNVNISGCTLDGKYMYKGAIHLGDSTVYGTNATVENNKIINFARGIQLGHRATEEGQISSTTISGNTFEGIKLYNTESKTGAVYIHENATDAGIESVKVTGNKVSDSTTVVFAEKKTLDVAQSIVTTFSNNNVNGVTTSELAACTAYYNGSEMVYPELPTAPEVTAPTFTTTTDGGYYAETKAAEAWKSATAVFNTEVSVDTADSYGMFVYVKSDENTDNKGVNLSSSNGLTGREFNAVIDGINDFEAVLVAMPYVTINGTTTYGEAETISVAEFKKWLGTAAE